MSIICCPIAYYWTSMSILICRNSLRGVGGRRAPAGRGRGDGDGDGGGGGFPRALESGRSPGPTCPGTKYPVRGIPHFDDCSHKSYPAFLKPEEMFLYGLDWVTLNTGWILRGKAFSCCIIEVRDSPHGIFWSLHTVPRGLTRWAELLGRRRRRRRHLILPGGAAAPPDPPFKSAASRIHWLV